MIGIALLLMTFPVAAYDYQGVPEQNTGDTTSSLSDFGTGSLDLSSLLGSVDITALLSTFLTIILRLLGISLP